MTRVLVHDRFRPFLEGVLPQGVEVLWYESGDEFAEQAHEAEVIWPDFSLKGVTGQALETAHAMRWCSVMSSGVDWLPVALLRERGVVLTNGAGLHAHSVAEFTVLGMLSHAKQWGAILAAQTRREWLSEPPGKGELLDAQVLVIGAGEIGQRIRTLLEAFDAQVTMARRTAGEGELGGDQWRAELGRFDWVILIVPSTAQTHHMMGAAEFAAMKPGAVLVNVARGDVVDQDALVAAIDSGHLGGAYLDVTDPEPLPADHPLWACPNVTISMHTSGLAQNSLYRRAAARFLDNLHHYLAGEPLVHEVDFSRGY